MPRRRPTDVPGLVEHTAPLAPGAAHVDPADPHRRDRPPTPGYTWWAGRLLAFVWMAAIGAGWALWEAFTANRWQMVVTAGLWALSAVVSHATLRRWESSPGTPRDTFRAVGGVALAFVLFCGCLPFVLP